MSENHSFKVDEIAGKMHEPNPKDLIFVNVCRISGPSQNTLDEQEEENNEDLEWMGATIYPEFVVKYAQSTSGGAKRIDLADIQRLFEVGVKIDGKIVIPTAIINRDLDRLLGRNESGEYDLFGKSLESFIKELGIHLYEGRRWYNLQNIKHEIEIIKKKSSSKEEGKLTAMRTNRGRYKNAEAGAPETKAPFLWNWKAQKKKKGTEKVILGVNYWIVDDRLELVLEIINRYRTNKYTYEQVADSMTKEGYRYYNLVNEEEHNISRWLVSEVIDNQTFYTGIWKRPPIRHKEKGSIIQPTIQLPTVSPTGKKLPDLSVYEELQAIKREHSTYNGDQRYDHLCQGIVRCRNCGQRISPIPRDHGKYRYYHCDKRYGGCGLSVSANPFEKSVLDMHEYLLKDPSRFIRSAQGNVEAIKADS